MILYEIPLLGHGNKYCYQYPTPSLQNNQKSLPSSDEKFFQNWSGIDCNFANVWVIMVKKKKKVILNIWVVNGAITCIIYNWKPLVMKNMELLK